MENWFNKKIIVDKDQRTYGVLFRVFGVDISLLFFGWMNQWSFVDLRIPVNYGIYLQVLFALATIGRLPTSAYEESDDTI